MEMKNKAQNYPVILGTEYSWDRKEIRKGTWICMLGNKKERKMRNFKVKRERSIEKPVLRQSGLHKQQEIDRI